ncbi:MAG: class I SAM-dependent methyltransferase [Candidatus Eisenbacteria bacterium]|nr:class I SAM-dependent methyltransferase [Candidatus Eisenbacteria bacterium]
MRRGRAYAEPLYYEIAFGFVDPARQADLFLAHARRHARVEPRAFLDIGCGPALQLRELARRGYRAVGLDRSARMLAHVRKAARRDGVAIETVRADMRSFRLATKVDFAFTMMGTVAHLRNHKEVLNHLGSVAAAVKRGGLYLIENLKLDWAAVGGAGVEGEQLWTMKRGDVEVRTRYSVRVVDALAQKVEETLTMEVDDRGERATLTDRLVTVLVFPEEFRLLVEREGSFEFVGWFERLSPRRLRRVSFDNVALLRRR